MWNALANMTSLYNINPDGAYDGQQQSLKGFQFDLEKSAHDVPDGLEVSGQQRSATGPR